MTSVYKKLMNKFIRNSNVVAYIVSDEIQEVTDIPDFINDIDFESQLSLETLQHRIDYYTATNDQPMLDFINRFSDREVLLIRIDDEDCEVYFIK